jgi:dolichol-phosphate mannosyltransferase
MLSIVVPVYNEESNVDELIGRLKDAMAAVDISYEIVFVNDGSSDRTAELILKEAEQNDSIRLVQFSRNFGHQIAVTAGLDFAQGDAVVVMDADLQDPPDLIPEMVKKWQDGFDVVYAVRKRRDHESWLMTTTRRLYYRLLQRIGDVDVPVDAGDFRLIDRCALDALSHLRENNRYVRGLCAWVGFHQTSVSYERPPRHGGDSKYSVFKLMKLALDGVTGFSNAPLRLVLWTGLAVAGLSFGLAFFAILAKFFKPDVVEGWSSLVLFFGFLSGIQLTALGIMADYLGRIHNEVKNRPIYVVSDVSGISENPEISEKAVICGPRKRRL